MLQKRDLYKIYKKLLKWEYYEPGNSSPLVREFLRCFDINACFEVLYEKSIFSYLKSLKKEEWLVELLYENLRINREIDLDYAIDLQINWGGIFYTEKLLQNEQFSSLVWVKEQDNILDKIQKPISIIIIVLLIIVWFFLVRWENFDWMSKYLSKITSIQSKNEVLDNGELNLNSTSEKHPQSTIAQTTKQVVKPSLSTLSNSYGTYIQNSWSSNENLFEISPLVYWYFRKRPELPNVNGTVDSSYPGTYLKVTLPKTSDIVDLLFKFQYTQWTKINFLIPYWYKLIFISEGNIGSDGDWNFIFYGDRTGTISYGLKKLWLTDQWVESVYFVDPTTKELTITSEVLSYSMNHHYPLLKSYLSTELQEKTKKVLNEEKNDKIRALLRFARGIKTKNYNLSHQKEFADKSNWSLQNYYDILFRTPELECYSSARIFLAFAQELWFEWYIIQWYNHYENSALAENPNYVNSQEAHAWTEIIINKKRYIFDVTPSIDIWTSSNNWLNQKKSPANLDGIIEFFRRMINQANSW